MKEKTEKKPVKISADKKRIRELELELIAVKADLVTATRECDKWKGLAVSDKIVVPLPNRDVSTITDTNNPFWRNPYFWFLVAGLILITVMALRGMG